MYCWGCFLFIYKNDIAIFAITIFGVVIEKHLDWLLCVSELHAHLYPYIVMYGLRLFIVVLQELRCLLNRLHVCMIRVRCCYHFTKFRCSTLSGF